MGPLSRGGPAEVHELKTRQGRRAGKGEGTGEDGEAERGREGERTSEVRLHDGGAPAGHLAQVAALDEYDVHDVVPDVPLALHLRAPSTHAEQYKYSRSG